MGVKAGSAIRARQREVAARVERLIAQADNRAPIGSARRVALQGAVRDGRRALRARARARCLVASAEADAGAALLRLVAEGLTQVEAFGALGLSTAVGRRLYADAAHAVTHTATRAAARVGPIPSTASGAERAPSGVGANRGTDAPAPGGGTKGID